jgi:hypothetical protein
VVYFSVILIFVLQNLKFDSFKILIKNVTKILGIFAFFSFFTVLFGTGIRDYFFAKSLHVNEKSLTISPSEIITESGTKNFNIMDKLLVYKQMALGRWIGMEGVLAVDAFPNKSFGLLLDALKEKSYHGNSFYNQISLPFQKNKTGEELIVSTSVPGPIAFFYYSGSKIFVFFAILISTLFFATIENFVLKYFHESQMAGIFVSTFIVFDFFQFGISPLAFVRYLVFSLSSLAVFYIFIHRKKLLLQLFGSHQS